MLLLAQYLKAAYALINMIFDRILGSVSLKEGALQLLHSAGHFRSDEELAKSLLKLSRAGKLPREFHRPRYRVPLPPAFAFCMKETDLDCSQFENSCA